MMILLVEDDEFKAADIRKVVAEFSVHQVKSVSSVTSALRALSQNPFDLVILDMSLPTFDLFGPGGGGSPEGQGGLEVLRLAKRLQHKSLFVVVTQYPDIEIDGRELPLSAAARSLSDKFGVTIEDCILYEFDSDNWRAQLRKSLHAYFRA